MVNSSQSELSCASRWRKQIARMFTVPPICRLGQPGYYGTCVMCRKVLYDDEDEEAQDEEMMDWPQLQLT